jgi:serine/threonine protein kinase
MSWDIPIGTEFAGYRILEILGRGGMSVVYAAEHIRLGRMVALKLMTPALAADESFRERFIRESRLAATLDHPNIIPIYDAGEADGFLYIAMRHVQGSDLGVVLKETGQLPIGQTLFYIEQVAGALDQAHEQGLVHRDVKPANILIAKPTDRVYLTDFGVVKATSSGGLTKTGYFLGTFEYAAPEQIEGKDVDGRTDVYALGCVVYESLSGQPPFRAETEASVIHAHLVEPPPKLTTTRPDLPLGINDVIVTAMAKAKEDRFSSAGELVRALRAVALGTGVSPQARGAREVSGAPETVFATPGGAGPPAPPGVGQAGGAPPTQLPPTGAPAAESPPPPPRGPRTVTLSGRRLAIAAAALVLIAGGIVAAVLVSGGSTKGAATTTSMSTDTNTMNMTTSSTSPSDLVGMLPSDVPKSSCNQTDGEHPGAINTVNCDFTGKLGNRILLHVDDFKSHKFLYSTYKAHGVGDERVAGGHPDSTLKKSTGNCSSTDWLGEGTWSHGGGGEVAGRRSCYLVPGSNKNCKPTKATSCSVIVWTLDISNLFMRAVYPSTRHGILFSWWKFHSHLFG